MRTKRKIILPHGGRTELAKLFDKSLVTIKSALDFRTDSDLAKRIRKAALARGGYEYGNHTTK